MVENKLVKHTYDWRYIVDDLRSSNDFIVVSLILLSPLSAELVTNPSPAPLQKVLVPCNLLLHRELKQIMKTSISEK